MKFIYFQVKIIALLRENFLDKFVFLPDKNYGFSSPNTADDNFVDDV